MLVDALRRTGARAVERVGDRFEAMLPAPPRDRIGDRVREARGAVRASTTLADPDVRCRWESHTDWAARWRAAQSPRRITDRIVVVPAGGPESDEAGPASRGQPPITIRLDPAMAFGTAEHPTTRACLRLMDARVAAGDRILDVGTGSGILGIAAALLGARRVTALEADPVAAGAARANAAGNGVADRVRVIEIEVRPGRFRPGRYDGVVANLEAGVLVPLIRDLARAVARDGWLIVSGILRSERAMILEEARRARLALDQESGDGWWTAAFVRRGGA